MKKSITLLAIISLISPTWSAVAHNSNSTTEKDSGSAATSPQTDTNMTVGSGSNRALLCIVGWDNTISSLGTVTLNWDSTGTNQAMTVIASTSSTAGDSSAQIFGLLAPTSGNHTLRVAWTTGTHEEASWCSDYTGVDQTSIATSFINITSHVGSTSPTSLTITSVSGDMTFDLGNAAASGPPANGGTQTTIFSYSGIGAINPFNGWELGNSPNNTHTWTGLSTTWEQIGLDILSSAASSVGSNKNKRLEKDE